MPKPWSAPALFHSVARINFFSSVEITSNCELEYSAAYGLHSKTPVSCNKYFLLELAASI